MINSSTSQPTQHNLKQLAKVLPVLPVERVGSAAQELSSKAKNFNIGQLYQAKVLEPLSDKTHLVKVDNTLLKMQLGDAGKTGQTLALRFAQLQPVPTFLLETASQDSGPKTKLSSAAQMINDLLKQAKAEGASNRFQAQGVVTQQPQDSLQVARDLSQAITKTGLFYESHLTDLAKGKRAIAQIKQEPQNTQTSQLASIVSQQLNVLETNKLSWQGEVWAGQLMTLDVNEMQDYVEREGHAAATQGEEDKPIQTDLRLNLPKLGDVKARLQLVDGQLSIQLSASHESTASMLKQRSAQLSDALAANGQALNGLTISQMVKESVKPERFTPVTLAGNDD